MFVEAPEDCGLSVWFEFRFCHVGHWEPGQRSFPCGGLEFLIKTVMGFEFGHPNYFFLLKVLQFLVKPKNSKHFLYAASDM